MVVDGAAPSGPASIGAQARSGGATEAAGAGFRHWLMRHATELRGRPLAIDPDIDAGYLGSVLLERGTVSVIPVTGGPVTFSAE
jgi:hypothetical protein